MEPQTLLQRGQLGYSKQQKQLRDAPKAPTPVQPVATTIGDKQYTAGGATINPYGAPITSSAMSPTTPVKLPEPTIPTAPVTARSAIEASTAGVKATPTPTTPEPTQQDNLTKVMQDVLGVQSEIATAQSSVDRAAQDAARQEADRYTSEIEAKANATRRQVEELRKNNPTGSFGGALEDQIKDIERASLSEQADLSILQNAALRRFDTAKSIADRQLELKLEPLKLKLDNLKFFYSENKDILNKADDRAYQEKIKQQEREYNKTATQEKALSDAKVDAIKLAQTNGADTATLQKIQSAKTPDEAWLSIGKFGQNSLDVRYKNAQIAKLEADARDIDKASGALTESQLKAIDASPQGKKLSTLSALYQKSNDYKNLVDTYGFKAKGDAKALIDRAYADLQITYKEAANLGALTGPDVGLIQNAIKPASGAANWLDYQLSGGKAGVTGAIDSGLKKARAEALTNYKQLTARNPNYAGSEYVQTLITPFAKDYSAYPDIEKAEKGDIVQTEDGILLEALGDGNFSPL